MKIQQTTERPRRSRFIGAFVAAAAVGLPLVVAAPAEATMNEKLTRYAGVYAPDEPEDLCGIATTYRVDYGGTYLIRAGKGKQAGAFFVHDNYNFVETYTNPANGRSLTISHNGVVQDIRATRVEGSIFEFVTHDVGQVFVVRDMNGDIVLRDRGRIAWTYLFDTLGDDVPGGVQLQDLDVQVSGPHPGYDISDEDFCAGVHDLIG